jgi:hypothetical protein
MATITLEVPDELARRLAGMTQRVPELLDYALDMAGIAGSSEPDMDRIPVWREVIDFLTAGPSPDEIIGYKVSPEAQERLEELLALARDGLMTPLERSEFESYEQINHLFVLLKARAHRVLAGE